MTREAMQQALDALSLIEEYGAPTLLAGVKSRDAAKALRAALAQPSEPFGYFRAEPFGWTDCAPTDEGAKALYEYPPEAPAWHNAPTCAGLWFNTINQKTQQVIGRHLDLEVFERTGARWYGPIPDEGVTG